jgi:phosphate starvation-inducible PhoH-like protein|nr:PhoH family protein [Neorhizobium tomejilense]
MGRKTSRTNERNQRIAQHALANLVLDAEGDPRSLDIKHRRAAPDSAYKKKAKAKTPKQQEFMDAVDNSTITFGEGPAGTGKTYIAVRKAIEMLATNQVNKIILSRPAMEAEGERLGFLPGSMEEKLHPYMLPIYDILKEALGQATLTAMMANGTIELCPLAFMRGRTFTNAVIVLDEMQNATMGQIKMALTRIGEGTKAIVTGDPKQSDLDPKLSGLVHCANALKGAEGVSVVRFDRSEIVRSAIVSTVLEALGE